MMRKTLPYLGFSLALHAGEHAYHHGFSQEWFAHWLDQSEERK